MLYGTWLHLSTLYGDKKLNKLDDSKEFLILKEGNKDRKWKNYGNKVEVKKLRKNGNKLKIVLKVYYI